MPMAGRLGEMVSKGLGELILKKASFSEGEEIVRFIEDDLALLNLMFGDLFRALPQHMVKRIREVMVRAEDVLITYSRTVSESRTVSIKRKPAYLFKVRSVIKQLRKMKDDIGVAKYALVNMFEGQLSPDHQSSYISSSLNNLVFYFLLFPAGFKIPARRLIALWIAEGVIKAKKYEHESVEDSGQRYLSELIHRDMVSVAEWKRNGEVKTCRLKDEAREWLLAQATEEEFLPRRTEDVRRLVDSSDTSTRGSSSIRILGNPSIYQDVPTYWDVISFLSFDVEQWQRERDDIGYFINKCILAGCFHSLKVVDLEGVYHPVLPQTMGELVLLKYLGLRWTYLKCLPGFVKGLLNLEVLDLKHTYITILPTSIWRMQYLRHLYLTTAYPTRLPRPTTSTVALHNLQTLWGALVDEDTCVKGGLDTLQSIRKLGLSCRPKQEAYTKMAQQLKAIVEWISNLRFLKSLTLKSRDVSGFPHHLQLTSLESNTNLSKVYLLGKLNTLVVYEFPVSLTDITLSGSELELDPMEFLARLPNLQSIRLLARSVMHSRIRCSNRGFPMLKKFCLWKLENLEELEVETGSLPCLEELDIRSCHNLQRPPHGLRHVNTLKKFKLVSMTDEFKDRSKELLEDMMDVIKFDLD